MSLVFLPVNILQIVFAAISVFGAILVIKNQRHHAMAALLAAIAGQMVFNILEETAGFRQVILVSPAFLFLFPPLFYLFSRGLVFAGKSLKWADAPHFVPFFFGLVFEGQFELVKNTALVSTLVYLGLTFQLIHRFHMVSPHIRSDAQSIRLRWVYAVIGTYVVHAVFDLMRMHLGGQWPWLISHDAYFMSLSLSLALIASMIYLALQHDALFEGLLPTALKNKQDKTLDVAGLGGEEFARLETRIIEEELHAEPRLSLAEVAIASGIEAREVSRLIKQATGKNFNDYINGLRVAEICRRLNENSTTPERTSILDIAFYCGFNSKSAFNAVFKKHMGQTPTAYLDSLPVRGNPKA